MARAGDELVNPVTGLRTVFRKTARETSGELLEVDWIGEPGWSTGLDHIHPRQEERFEVLSGKLGLRVEGIERVLSTGETTVAPAGSAHAAWNASSDDEVHVLVDFKPVLRTETAFETLAGLARDGKTNKAGAPRNPLLLALVLHHFEEEIYFVRPPLVIHRVIFGALAKVARLLGYRAEHPYPYARRSETSRAGMYPNAPQGSATN
jgi:quercetin dioxygenase-like cupin family protein